MFTLRNLPQLDLKKSNERNSYTYSSVVICAIAAKESRTFLLGES
jgi:hypothetical protein